MVYCGPPSKGCSNCRDRKIKCDQREPGCGQCAKRQQKCPGYRNMVDLMFRDESSHVIKKAQARHNRRRAAATVPAEYAASLDTETPASLSPSSSSTVNGSSIASPAPLPTPSKPEDRPRLLTLLTPSTTFDGTPNSTGESSTTSSYPPPQILQQRPQNELVWTRDESLLPSPDGGSWPATPMIAQSYNLAPTYQESGTAFFFSRYVTVDSNAMHHRFDFIYDVWKPGSLASDKQLDAVMASMTAVGLMGMAQLTGSKEVAHGALESFGTALCLTKALLEIPGESEKDTTMLAFLILGIFMMGDSGKESMQTWHDHIAFAVELASRRGAGQFQTRAGIRMFHMLCQYAMISSAQRQEAMPPVLVDLQSILLSASRKRERLGLSSVDVSTPVYKILQTRRDLKSGQLYGLDEVLLQLDDIEKTLDQAVSSLREISAYKVFRITRPNKAVFCDTCHVYANVKTATVWNLLRACRILVLESVLTAIQQHFAGVGDDVETVPARYVTKYRETWSRLQLVVSSLLASVPQHFGLVNPVNPYFDTLRPIPAHVGVSPVSTTEVRENLTPPAQSPASSVASTNTSSVSSVLYEDRPEGSVNGGGGSLQRYDSNGGEEAICHDDSGPTLENPTRAQSLEGEIERFVLLATATNSIVWPLFCVGVSTICTGALKEYVVERLNAIHGETGLAQARTLASMVRNRERIKSPWLKRPFRKVAAMPPPPAPSMLPIRQHEASPGNHVYPLD